MSPFRYLAIAALAFSAIRAEGGLPNFRSRAIESSNGQYVLVILKPKTERSDLSEHVDHMDQMYGPLSKEERRRQIEPFEHELALETHYPAGGLYANDDSTTAQWTLPYIDDCQKIHVANDGLHVVVMYSPWDSTCSGTRQLSFIASGRTAFSYVSEWEFLPFSSLRLILRACLGMEMPIDDISVIDDESKVFEISTNQGDRLAFDLATGKRLQRSAPLFIWYMLAPAFLFPVFIYLHRKIRLASTDPVRHGLQFSLADLLFMVTCVACSIVACKSLEWFGGAWVLIAITGALVAGFPKVNILKVVVGAVSALYGAYVGIVLFAIVDDWMLNSFELSPLWWERKWWLLSIPGSVILSCAVVGSLLARRIFTGQGVA